MNIIWVLMVLVPGHVIMEKFDSRDACQVEMVSIVNNLQQNIIEARCVDKTDYGMPA